jgi:hypothetical protein
VSQGPRGNCLMKKTIGRKSRVRVPLTCLLNKKYMKSSTLLDDEHWAEMFLPLRHMLFYTVMKLVDGSGV